MIDKAPKTFFIKTFGCQANEADSQHITGLLEAAGLKPASQQAADWVIINSCVVRQRAEDRIAGFINNIAHKGDRRIFLTGCIFYHNRQYLEKNYSAVDYFVKATAWEEFLEKEFGWPVGQDSCLTSAQHFGWRLVPIMTGCDNFCSYCIVPYARGRESSRSMETVLKEVSQLAGRGEGKILLLGQNVAAYGKDFATLPESQFSRPLAGLIEKISQIPAVEEIKFLSAHPADFDKELVKMMGLAKVSSQLHLPLQSGDDEVLRRMNRRYTGREYQKLVDKIRQKVSDLQLTTDILVGFPGESREQFNNTVELCRRINFHQAFINKYSPRPKTKASQWEDNVSWTEKKRRWHVLEQLINQ